GRGRCGVDDRTRIDRTSVEAPETTAQSPMGLAVPPERHRIAISPLNRRRWQSFKANRRGFWSLWIFLVLFVVSLFAEFIANDRPLLVRYEGSFYLPVLHDYPETAFGGDFPSRTDYRDPAITQLINEKGWIVWPLIPFSYRTITDAPGPFPPAPSATAWLGTDDQRRDVLPRLIYGFRSSVLFGLARTGL